jgi:hypothetical protein
MLLIIAIVVWGLASPVSANAQNASQSVSPSLLLPPSQRVEGHTQDELFALFGQPADRVQNGTQLERVKFATTSGELIVYFNTDGRSVLLRPVRTFGPSAAEPDDLLRQSKKAAESGDDWRAIAPLDQCLRALETNKKCKAQLANVARAFRARFAGRVDVASENELQDAAEFLGAVLAADSGTDRESNLAMRARVSERLLGVAAPKLSAAYKAASAQAMDATLRAVEEALGRSDYEAAIAAIGRSSEQSSTQLTQARERVNASAAAHVAGMIERFEKDADLRRERDLSTTLVKLGPALGEDGTKTARVRFLASFAKVVRQQAGLNDSEVGPLLSRVLEEILRREHQTIVDANDFPWGELAGVEPLLPVRLVVTLDSSCGSVLQSAELNAGLARAIPFARLGGNAAPVRMKVEATCDSATTRGQSQAVPSVYRAATQQTVNPEYVQAQSALQAAQVRLAQVRLKWALNPPANAWSGAAKGIEEAAATGEVTRLARLVESTAPFLEQPVEAPYQLSVTEVRKRADVNIDVEFTVADGPRLHSAQVKLRSEARGTETKGAMATDRRGAVNSAATLPDDAEMFAQAIRGARDEDLKGLRAPLAESLIASLENQKNLDTISLLATLLFLRDTVGLGDSVLAPYADALSALNSADLRELHSLSVQIPRASAAAAPGKVATIGTKPRTRAQMIASVRDAVATVESGATSGTGFFITSDGALVTNAHVVDGSTRIRIRTPSKDVFLASVIRIDAANDLALLRVPGYSGTFLTLAKDEAGEVGTDVIAIGNPLGLEGTVTRGIVSARRTIDGVPVVQIDAAINPGNSGGPLIDEEGNVIGVNSWKLRGDRAESLGFAVSVAAVRKSFGPYIGVR